MKRNKKTTRIFQDLLNNLLILGHSRAWNLLIKFQDFSRIP